MQPVLIGCVLASLLMIGAEVVSGEASPATQRSGDSTRVKVHLATHYASQLDDENLPRMEFVAADFDLAVIDLARD